MKKQNKLEIIASPNLTEEAKKTLIDLGIQIQICKEIKTETEKYTKRMNSKFDNYFKRKYNPF